jgi:flagellar biosynthesis/type III secretory pathway M-ring protein FliF/YscJ
MKEKIGIFLLIVAFLFLLADHENLVVSLILGGIGLILFFFGKKIFEGRKKREEEDEEEDDEDDEEENDEDKKILVDFEGDGETLISLEVIRQGGIILVVPPKT